ncbi:MAG: HD domain-containing protein [Candidatus Cryptobacteroides sp.]
MTYEEMICHAHDELISALPSSFDAAQVALVEDAFTLAREAHANQTRKSGLPYILHPLAVALIVAKDMRQHDAAVIAAALLHDVVEDTDNTIDDIKERFGPDVAFLVGAVTKPNKAQVDNFQHILGSVKGDIRVLILKLSDRLHNMRTLESMRPQKQWKIASETQFFFAPLAGRLGLYKVKSELENLAFRFLNPQEYAFVEKALAEDRERTREAVESFMRDASAAVSEVLGDSVCWDIRYRKPFSVWREMQELGCDFYHVPFKHYIRAAFNPADVGKDTGHEMSEQDAVMKIYSTLASSYREQTGTFVNYMAQPKANGYRSVHFRLLNPYGGIEEFHVGSYNMREQSYFGCIIENQEQWLVRFTKVLNELAEDPESLMPGIRDSFYNEDVVVFTPKSTKPITLPKGATALDYAYGVNVTMGDHAKYARINGRLSSIKTVLKRGDCVEIGTSDSSHPKADWLDSVVSYKAKKHIRNYLKRQPSPKYILCPHCHPMPGSEIIGFEDAQKRITVHSRNCPDAIRIASEMGNTIVSIDDFFADPAILYPVRIIITGVDRYHLLRDIIDCIVEQHKLSMTSLSTNTVDDIATCNIEFAVHSATELKDAISSICAIEGVEEVRQSLS